jgi:hypothetical protein
MPQYGSSQNLISTNLSQTVDNQGNPIISSDTGYGASPLGYAARAQALFGLPNSTFELTPPDTTAVISAANPLPYWDVQDYSSGVMSGSAIYDSTTNSWGVNLNPGTATTNDYITMTTRSYLINDSNLSLRQQAFAIVSKVGTYSSTTQWNLELTASYYDSTNTLLHSGTVATIYDNATWTSMAGTTTTSGTAINAAAHYVDLQFKLTATAAVTSATSVTIKSVILTTSTGIGKSLLVTETFTSSGTWTRPTGVNYLVAVAGYSGGNGGNGGDGFITRSNASLSYGKAGQPGVYGLLRDIYVGDQTTVSVGIGAGGAGGAGGTATKAVGVTTATITGTGASGGVGGNTTFGSYLVCSTNATNNNGAQTGTVTTTIPFPDTILTSVAFTEGTATIEANGYLETNGFTGLPYQSVYAAAGANGTNGTALGATVGGKITTRGGVRTLGGTAGLAGVAMSMGGQGAGVRIDTGGGYAYVGSSLPSGTATYYGGSAGQGGAGGGGGSGLYWIDTTAGTALSANGGNGGSASANSGSGGGAGGFAAIGNSATSAAGTTAYTNSSGTATGGNGGNGGSGYLVVAYIA